MKIILPQTGDLRFTHLANKAQNGGFEVLRYNEKMPLEKSIFILPFGMNEGEILHFLERTPENSFVFLGKGSDEVKALAAKKKINLTCLMEKKRYLIKNALHTAEGALSEIIARIPRRLDELCFLVYGYGNCGSAIAKLLWLCGCEIWVWSRERGQALAEADGFNIFPAPTKGLGMFDAVINTVPDPIFSESFLSTMQKGSFFFQIASGLSGIDPSLSESLDFHLVPLHGLPGKYCPASEADAIWEEIEYVLNVKRSIL